MWGVELVRAKATREPFPAERKFGLDIQQHAFEAGLVVRALGDTLVFAPPLIVNQEQVDEILRRFASALDAGLHGFLKSGGVLEAA